MVREETALAYRQDGFAVVTGVLDGPAIAASLEDLGYWRARQGLGPDAAIVPVRLDDPDGRRIAGDPRIGAIASALLEVPAVAFGVTFLCKPAGHGPPALWHQDGEPWTARLGGSQALTVWIALDDTDSANGCLRVIPGSHSLHAQPLRVADKEPSLFGVEMDPALVDETRAVDLPLRAGDASVHHPSLVHGSGPNRSDRPRRALAVRYVGEGSRQPSGAAVGPALASSTRDTH
ncbi:MAG: phytanoyl-CoA dioxygenase family protein [Acidimicrobiales bacterium]